MIEKRKKGLLCFLKRNTLYYKTLNTNPDICIRKQYLIIFKFTENKVCFNVMT